MIRRKARQFLKNLVKKQKRRKKLEKKFDYKWWQPVRMKTLEELERNYKEWKGTYEQKKSKVVWAPEIVESKASKKIIKKKTITEINRAFQNKKFEKQCELKIKTRIEKTGVLANKKTIEYITDEIKERITKSFVEKEIIPNPRLIQEELDLWITAIEFKKKPTEKNKKNHISGSFWSNYS